MTNVYWLLKCNYFFSARLLFANNEQCYFNNNIISIKMCFSGIILLAILSNCPLLYYHYIINEHWYRAIVDHIRCPRTTPDVYYSWLFVLIRWQGIMPSNSPIFCNFIINSPLPCKVSTFFYCSAYLYSIKRYVKIIFRHYSQISKHELTKPIYHILATASILAPHIAEWFGCLTLDQRVVGSIPTCCYV